TLQSQELRHLETGIELKDGITAPAQVKKIRKAEENSWIELTIYEGRTHQVKRMLEAVGHPVLKLKRVRFGPLTLGNLPSGEYRFLTDPEIHQLKTAAAQSSPSKGEGQREGHPFSFPPPSGGRVGG